MKKLLLILLFPVVLFGQDWSRIETIDSGAVVSEGEEISVGQFWGIDVDSAYVDSTIYIQVYDYREDEWEDLSYVSGQISQKVQFTALEGMNILPPVRMYGAHKIRLKIDTEPTSDVVFGILVGNWK